MRLHPNAKLVPTQRFLLIRRIRRVFELDVLECPRCSGRCEVMAGITEPQVIRPFLARLGLSTRAPPIVPARSAPQPDLPL